MISGENKDTLVAATTAPRVCVLRGRARGTAPAVDEVGGVEQTLSSLCTRLAHFAFRRRKQRAVDSAADSNCDVALMMH